MSAVLLFCLVAWSIISSHSAISRLEKSMRCCSFAFAHPAPLSLSRRHQADWSDASKKIHARLAASFTFFSTGRLPVSREGYLGKSGGSAAQVRGWPPLSQPQASLRRDRTQQQGHTRLPSPPAVTMPNPTRSAIHTILLLLCGHMRHDWTGPRFGFGLRGGSRPCSLSRASCITGGATARQDDGLACLWLPKHAAHHHPLILLFLSFLLYTHTDTVLKNGTLNTGGGCGCLLARQRRFCLPPPLCLHPLCLPVRVV